MKDIYIKLTHKDDSVEEHVLTANVSEMENLLKFGERFYLANDNWGLMIAVSDCKRIEWKVIEKQNDVPILKDKEKEEGSESDE